MLDQQWGKDTVWQEDYFALMNATQVASRITFVPQDTEMYLKLFPTYHENAIKEVLNSSNIASYLYLHCIYNTCIYTVYYMYSMCMYLI